MDKPNPPPDIRRIQAELPDAKAGTFESFDVKEGEGQSEQLVDAIEMIGEEQAAGLTTPSPITPGMRFLHSSRTIHQLVTDRNRAVGIFLAVASLLLTASGAIFNAKPESKLIIPFEEIQRWCLPIAFATLMILAVFMAFLLTRTRVGLIYEVAKMNALLGLPIGRVQRNNPLSIHFILQLVICSAGGGSAAFFAIYMIRLDEHASPHAAAWIGAVCGLIVTVALLALDMITVNVTTADHRLQSRTEEKK